MGYDTRNESKKKQKKYERHKSNVLVKVVRAKLISTWKGREIGGKT